MFLGFFFISFIMYCMDGVASERKMIRDVILNAVYIRVSYRVTGLFGFCHISHSWSAMKPNNTVVLLRY